MNVAWNKFSVKLLNMSICQNLNNMSVKRFRKDRVTETTGGGIFILVKNTIVASKFMDADSDCEVLWVKVEVSGNKPLFVGAYYY